MVVDRFTLATVPVVILIAVAAAIALPSIRAVRVDPVATLRGR
jgi:ABC-type antimicrobial peptide transport system permease subunit